MIGACGVAYGHPSSGTGIPPTRCPHSGGNLIGLHTPADVHFGLVAQKADERSTVLADARRTHPERFGTSDRGPKILGLPTEAWINEPITIDDTEPPADQTAA